LDEVNKVIKSMTGDDQVQMTPLKKTFFWTGLGIYGLLLFLLLTLHQLPADRMLGKPSPCGLKHRPWSPQKP